MKKIISALFVFGIIILNAAAQAPPNAKQIKVAEQFIAALKSQEFDKCWSLLDKKMSPDLDKNEFIVSLKKTYESMPDKKDEFELYKSNVKRIDGNEMFFYSFKYKTDICKPGPIYLIEFMFVGNKSKLVAGVQYEKADIKINQAASSRGDETVITTNEIWVIDSTEYKIVGVNIVHFPGKSGAIVVQVEHILPENVDLKMWTYQEGIKFAKYLYKTTAYTQALEKAKELNIELYPVIGVSFINTTTGQGYNVAIKSEDYQ